MSKEIPLLNPLVSGIANGYVTDYSQIRGAPNSSVNTQAVNTELDSINDRKVKDAKDLTTDELIYFKSHAKATYMSSGDTVEEIIVEIKEDYKTYNDNLAKKQDKLESGTNIKTINGESVLGSGNINIPKIVYLENEDALPSNPDANTLYVVGDN